MRRAAALWCLLFCGHAVAAGAASRCEGAAFVADTAATQQNEEIDTARWAVKSNLLQWPLATPNLAVEMGLGSRWTFELSYATCPFEFDGGNKKWRHWQATAEFRYWFHHRFDGHFLGLHAGGGEYNLAGIKLPFGGFEKDYRYEGWMLRAGLTYGYSWRLDRHWNIEALIGAGITHAEYRKYVNEECGRDLGRSHKDFFAPTRAGLSLVYTFGRRRPTCDPVYLTEFIHTSDTIVQTVSVPVRVTDRICQEFPFLALEGTDGPCERLPLRFRLDRTDIDASYSRNTEMLQLLEQAMDTLRAWDDVEMTRISITGYASPEGPVAHNYDLSVDRAKALHDYIAGRFGIPEWQMQVTAGGEDWLGLYQLIKASDMVDKEEALRILARAGVLNQRPEGGPVLTGEASERLKKQLQKLRGGRTWHSIQDVLFPQLRDASYITVWFRETKPSAKRWR